MSENELYKIDVNGTEDFPYVDVKTQDFALYPHYSLPQNYKYEFSNISPDNKYIALVGKGLKDKETDILFIWEMSNLYKNRYIWKDKKIHGVCFSPRNNSFVIVYENKPPCFYNIKNGKRISKFKDAPSSEAQSGKILSYSFSPNGHFFGISYENYFLVWEVIKGERLMKYDIKSKLKFFSKNTLVSITYDDKVIVTKIDGNVKENPESRVFSLVDSSLSYSEINDGMVNTSETLFYMANQDFVFSLDLQNGEIKTVINFEPHNMARALFCGDCSQVVVTDYRKLYFYTISNEIQDDLVRRSENDNEPTKVGTILKEKFHSFSVDFDNNILITVDNVAVNITNFYRNTEQFIFVDENVTKFQSYSFSPDYEYILAIIDEHRAVIYSLETGRVIKKWNNICEKWSDCCIMAPPTSETAIIATKSTKDEVKIWSYQDGSDVSTLPGFDVASLCFNESGKYLAAGGKEGEEIVRVWNLENGNYFSIKHENRNRNTKVLFTKSSNNLSEEIIIAAGEGQNPISYYLESPNPICEYQPINGIFISQVTELEANPDSNILLVKGLDSAGKNYGLVYNLSDGKPIMHLDECINCTLSKDEPMLLARCSNYNEGKLFVMDFEAKGDLLDKIIDCSLQNADCSSFIQGSKAVVSAFGEDNSANYILNMTKEGKMIGELKIEQKSKLYCELDLSADPNENCLIFRHIHLEEDPYDLTKKKNDVFNESD